MPTIFLRLNFSTIINFPVKPENVILGTKRMFSMEYIKNDLAITSLHPGAKTNLFAYMTGRRCGFRLVTSPTQHDNLVNVRDSEDSRIKVKMK